MRAHERLAGQLVERAREPFRQAAAVHEEQRRLMGPNQFEQTRMHRCPDRGRTGPCDAGRSGLRAVGEHVGRGRVERHVLDGTSIRSARRFFSEASMIVTGRYAAAAR
jgi:hypothetical protein